MIYVAFLGGVFVGSIITRCLMYLKSGYGWFRIEPFEDDDEDDLYMVKIFLKKGQSLLKKKQIILKRDYSQQ